MTPHLAHALNLFLNIVVAGAVFLSPFALIFYLGEKGYGKTAAAVFTVYMLLVLFFDVYAFTS